MTHDELLARIDSMEMRYKNEIPRRNALRAVVKLHKPDTEPDTCGTIGCIGCGFDSEYQAWDYAYPCPTIQAIEEELK